MTNPKILAYAAHFDGTECAECNEPCHWDDTAEQLQCHCSNRTPMSIWLGNTPTA